MYGDFEQINGAVANSLQAEIEQLQVSLRDEFAMAALQGMVANAGRNGLLPLDASNKGAKEKYATLAYEFSDAMIKERCG